MSAYKFDTAYRPTIIGTRYAISAGHYLAAQVGFQILQAGGNAIDAGVAAGLTLNVVEPQMCSFTGVAPIMIFLAQENRFFSIDGLGTWPQRVTCELLSRFNQKCVPEGILQTVVPAAPDAWLTALDRFGTMTFAEVADSAVRFARDGFAVSPMMALTIRRFVDDFPPGTDAAAIFLPRGRPPDIGEIFLQPDLARSLQFLVDEETGARRKGRRAGLAAVRDAMYFGDLANQFVKFQRANGGLLDSDDLASYRVTIETPISVSYRGVDVYSCGPWCQGPMLLQVLRMADVLELERLSHNSAEYIHSLTEVIKLVAADREAYYGDPKFIPVPIDILLSDGYARERAQLVQRNRAWSEMPPAGDIGIGSPEGFKSEATEAVRKAIDSPLDTSYVCVVDGAGNAFSATPSDGVIRKSPVVPGTGMVLSPRGSQSRIEASHPSCVAPRKRPRLTPNPAMAVKNGEYVMPFGTPGGDLQVQAMAQTFLNIVAYRMDPQRAVECARFYSYSFPDSFAPHSSYPGVLRIEDGITKEATDTLASFGHKIVPWPNDEWPRTGVCLVIDDRKRKIKLGAADCRRTGYALGC